MDEDFKCSICRMEYDLDSIRMLSCHHTLCIDCLRETIEMAVSPENTEGLVQKLKCPERGCQGVIDKFVISSNTPGLFEQYSSLVVGRGLIDAVKEDEVLL